jgi:GR25 family glycosyltransferase involved in LPS biosynthesis
MKGNAYVLNLKRRPDRLERFQKFYSESGPELPLKIFEAIDGSNSVDFDKVPLTIIKNLSNDNDYNNKNSIRATAYSHMMIWKEISEDLENDYGIIYEDDCYFRQTNKKLPDISGVSMKNKWSNIINEYSKELEKPKSILYFGVGDLLPVHTVPPSESMLIAQESNHVIKPNIKKYYGSPNFKSPYVFSWLGCSSYVISKITAKYLLAIASRQSLNCAIDAWLKRLYEKQLIDIYLTIPLLTYCPDIMDSNTSFPEKGYI